MAAQAPAFQPPSWATPASFPYKLDVLKDGVQTETIDIATRSFYLIGKRPDTSHIVLSHESISRTHGAFVYGEQGELYVCDLGSTHGTKMNKVRLVANKYQLCPVGSVLQFGASTRLYVVDGPKELAPPEQKESAAHAKLREASEERQRRKSQEKLLGGPGVSWGQADDAVDDGSAFQADAFADDGEGGTSAKAVASRLRWLDRVDLQKLDEKTRAAFDRVHKLALKLRHLMAEVDRIKAKQGKPPRAGAGGGGGRKKGGGDEDDAGSGGDLGGGAGIEGLSEGQVAQIARNEEAIDKALGAIDEEEDALKERLVAKGFGLPKGVPHGPSRGPGGGFGSGSRREPNYMPDATEDVEDHSSASWNGGGASAAAVSSARGKFVLKKVGPGAVAAPSAVAHASNAPALAISKTRAPAATATAASKGLETYESLSAKLSVLDDELGGLVEAEARAAQGGSGSASSAGGADGDDELEAYMQRTNASIAATEAAVRRKRIDDLQGQREGLAKLVEMARPVLLDALGPASNAMGAVTKSETHVDLPKVLQASLAPPAEAPIHEAAATSTKDDGAPALIARPDEFVAASVASSEVQKPVDVAAPVDDTPVAPTARPAKRVLGPAMPPPSALPGDTGADTVGDSNPGVAPPIKKARTAPTSVPSSSLSAALSKSTAGPSSSAAQKSGFDALPRGSGGEESDLTWRPPSGQTGDGRTSLNERLGY